MTVKDESLEEDHDNDNAVRSQTFFDRYLLATYVVTGMI
jgi:hypothetical protein